jgi:hypothetical protein
VSRYDLFRRRIAPVAFVLAIVLMARDACNHDQRTHATIVFDLGSASRASALDAELVVGATRVATFHEAPLGGTLTTAEFDASLPDESDGELRIELEVGSGAAATHPRTTRRFHAEEGSTVTVPLADLAR